MTNPNKTVVSTEVYNAVVRDLVKTNAENERLKTENDLFKSEYLKLEGALHKIEDGRGGEPKEVAKKALRETKL